MATATATTSLGDDQDSEVHGRLLETRGPRATPTAVQIAAQLNGAEAALLAGLDALASLAVDIQGKLVASAVNDAGGINVVSTGIKEAWLLTGDYWSADLEAADLEAKAAVVASIESQLAQLGDATAGKTALATERNAAMAALDAARCDADGRIMARISGLVAGAMAGDETTRAAIEGVARHATQAFAADFADSLRNARIEYSGQGSRTVALLRSVAAE